ncbi:Signal peptidase IB [Fusobacterium necrogenes]|uniref:Signal peptidase I n=1 Tax=Fusobacterium necrogenes TaxID=858 RepID=A0A377GNS7_9FUSO|nr:signal peptidase I [Fusobacterium necrogenes]STO26870.1 Signal peptidase IB [Fusobacterium necrogenes]
MIIRNKLKKFIKILVITLGIVYTVKLYIYNNYCINITPSIPKGIYKLQDIKNLERNKIVYIEIPDNAKKIIWEREYLPQHINYLVKYIKGIPGDSIQVKNNNLYINGEFKGNIKKYDLQGKKLNSELPIDYVLKENEYILLGSDNNSYDSRYFGIIKKDKILKEASKINFSYVTRVKH